MLLMLSCTTADRLEIALEMSGTNRVALEKVLSHYSINDADSLKLQAAIFLIENMPEHYTYDGEFLRTYMSQMDALNPSLSLQIKTILYSDLLKNRSLMSILRKKYDIGNLSSDYLIKNIDYKFKLWESVPWGESVSFNDFCEYILPYRNDNEPIFDLNEDSLSHHIDTLKSIVNSLTDYYITISDSKEYIINKLFDSNELYARIILPDRQGYYKLDCSAITTNLLENMKSICIPAMFDYVPHWANSNGRHYWVRYIDTYDKNTLINYIYRSRVAKIYRKTYSHNKSPQNDENYIPELFTPFIKDVTAEYINTRDIRIYYGNCRNENVKNVYLSVFNDQCWRAIDWSTVDRNGFANFKNMGTDIVYLPSYFVGNNEIIADYPFILKNNGQINKLVPNNDNKLNVIISRKFPKDIHKFVWDENLIGTKILASNNLSFDKCDTIDIIRHKAQNSNYIINVDTLKKYQYFKLSKSDDFEVMFLSELAFFDRYGENIVGKYIFPEKSATGNLKLFDNKAELLSDKDPVSFTSIKNNFIVDFGKPISVMNISITLRNDGNYIYPNNTYELLYCGKNGWISHGTKDADGYFIEFDNIPSEALYWLRNLTKGKEERIFTYENGKVKFW